jgi:flagellar basal-body rod modification protein FlgD
MASDVTTTGAAQKAQNTAQQKVTLAEDFSQFLTLLTTQLQNQDPLSPMDSTEFTNQLVQFSQVEQQINSNQKLDDLVALQLSGISTVALGYVGMDISYLSAEANFDGTKPVTINYSLSDPAIEAKINIYDEAGDLVYNSVVPKDVGRNEFVWDGKDKNGQIVPEGTYSIKIDAIDSADDPITVSTAVSGKVRGIEQQNGIVMVLVGERAVPIANILQARQPETAPVEEADTGDTGTDDV